MVEVPLEQLTNRQLHLHLIALLGKQGVILDRLDIFMSDLTDSVAALQGAVDNMAVRFNAQNAVLTDALDAALIEVQRLIDEDVLEDAAAAETLNAALADAQAAAQQIQAEVAELNGIGAAPEVPVEEVPVEELPAPPSEG